MSYSRVGIFDTDTAGYLIDSNGKKVQGYGPAKGGALGTMGDIKVPTGQIAAVATTSIAFVGNLSADWTAPTAALNLRPQSPATTWCKQSIVYDSPAPQHTVSQYFVKSAMRTTSRCTTPSTARRRRRRPTTPWCSITRAKLTGATPASS
jgi:flagellar hook protein FlgE